MSQTKNCLPAAFIERLTHIVPAAQLDSVLASMQHPRRTAFRINTLMDEAARVLPALQQAGFRLEPLNRMAGAYSVPAGQRRALTESEPYHRGAIYIQNPASMLPPLLLQPQPGERVLDLAAAPGSKTLQLAAMMDNRGWISAVEVVRERFFRLRRNLDKHGAQIVHTYNKDGSRVWRQVAEQFDRVLLDAPCSSEGQFTTLEPESFRYWSRKKIKEMSRKQKRLLYSAIQCVKPGGLVLYSTCTFAPEENEAIVSKMLRKFSGRLEVVPVEVALENSVPGLSGWNGRRYAPELQQALRILPNELMEGFFVCLLRKTGSTMGDD